MYYITKTNNGEIEQRPVTFMISQVYGYCVASYEMISHTVSDASGVLNKESLCADRLTNLNSVKQDFSTRHRLYDFIPVEVGGSHT